MSAHTCKARLLSKHVIVVIVTATPSGGGKPGGVIQHVAILAKRKAGRKFLSDNTSLRGGMR